MYFLNGIQYAKGQSNPLEVKAVYIPRVRVYENMVAWNHNAILVVPIGVELNPLCSSLMLS